ncbi:hypothetical protein [Streptomyces decoyicus]|uniref:hypothetical protein n=1 Tax=Streptomyces decoyicus TaxID=249567 RepID=UPI0033B6AA1F
MQARHEAGGDQRAEWEILAAERTGSGGGATDAGAGGTGAGSLDVAYVLTTHGRQELVAFGVDTERLPRRRASVRYCVDWAEQRHHLAGALGAALTARLFDLEWLRHRKYRRVVHLTDAGREGLATTFGVRGDQAE